MRVHDVSRAGITLGVPLFRGEAGGPMWSKSSKLDYGT